MSALAAAGLITAVAVWCFNWYFNSAPEPAAVPAAPASPPTPAPPRETAEYVALRTGDFAGFRRLVDAGANGGADLEKFAAQTIRWLDLTQPAPEAISSALDVLVANLGEKATPRAFLLVSRIFGRLALDPAREKTARALEKRVDVRNRDVFLLQAFLITPRLPADLESRLRAMILKKDPASCREGALFLAQLKSSDGKRRLVRSLIPKVKALPESCQPVAAVALVRATEAAARRRPEFRRLADLVRAGRDEAWNEARAALEAP